MFGPADSQGEESFDIIICNSGWLNKQAQANGIASLRHHLLVDKFDIEKIRAFLIQYGNTCAGENWNETANKLARLGHWEFEDYQKH